MPNVHKLKKVNAKQALANADCGVKVKKKVTHKKKFRGKVLKQKKAPGTTGAPGLVVPIVIGQK
ncbi:MAG TPA: PASTA domain-containing protein [Solirubrobacterales bacterium]